jgi:hypothetical protein
MTKLSDKRVAAIKAQVAEGSPSQESPSNSRSAARWSRTSPPAASTRTCPGPTMRNPVPSGPAVSTSRIPTMTRPNNRILELESEIVHLTDERNRERQKVKAGAKVAGLFKAIVGEMEQRIKPFTALPPALGLPPQGPDHGSLRAAPLGRPPRSGRAAGGGGRPGGVQLPDLLCPRRAATWTP